MGKVTWQDLCHNIEQQVEGFWCIKGDKTPPQYPAEDEEFILQILGKEEGSTNPMIVNQYEDVKDGIIYYIKTPTTNTPPKSPIILFDPTVDEHFVIDVEIHKKI
jgi:hypothetical protein